MKRVALLSLLLVSVLVFTSGCALWKFSTGEISGVAYDQTGAVLKNVRVDVYLGAQKSLEVNTDNAGKFAVTDLRAGNYRLVVVGAGLAGEGVAHVTAGETTSVELIAQVVVPVQVHVVDKDGKAWVGTPIAVSGMAGSYTSAASAVTIQNVPVGDRTFTATVYNTVVGSKSVTLTRDGLATPVVIELPISAAVLAKFDSAADLDKFDIYTGPVTPFSANSTQWQLDSTGLVVENGVVKNTTPVGMGAYMATKEVFQDAIYRLRIKTGDVQGSLRVFTHASATPMTGWGINNTNWFQLTPWGIHPDGYLWRTLPQLIDTGADATANKPNGTYEYLMVVHKGSVQFYKDGVLHLTATSANWNPADVGPMPTTGRLAFTIANATTFIDEVEVLRIH